MNNPSLRKVLVTGAAGFIGFHLVRRLAEEGDEVFGLDNINEYYDPSLKLARMSECGICSGTGYVDDFPWHTSRRSTRFTNYRFIRMDICDSDRLQALFAAEKFTHVVHLAAQAGVRYSLQNPEAYAHSNLAGFLSMLEACRRYPVRHLVYASSSSVYGLNARVPFREADRTDHPISLYAATKKSNELMAHSYSHLFGIPCTGLRLFTVYGPWGRPDMALFIFTEKILKGEPLPVYQPELMARDFTYVDDVVEGIYRIMSRVPVADSRLNGKGTSFRICNIGGGRPVPLMDFIRSIEKATRRRAILDIQTLQPGDVEKTWADCSAIGKVTGYLPYTDLDDGVREFVQWYKVQYTSLRPLPV